MKKTYNVYEQIGNFANIVFTSDNFYEVQDYLQERFLNSGYNVDDESEEELFYSYFHIEEIAN